MLISTANTVDFKRSQYAMCINPETTPHATPPTGEKPFETVEDLVQDGLITLYMEVNNVEDYLKSARETMQRQPSRRQTPQVRPPMCIASYCTNEISIDFTCLVSTLNCLVHNLHDLYCALLTAPNDSPRIRIIMFSLLCSA